LFTPILDKPLQFKFSASVDILYIHGCPFDTVASLEEFRYDGMVWNKQDLLQLIHEWGNSALQYSEEHL
jgi:hypothetical protein